MQLVTGHYISRDDLDALCQQVVEDYSGWTYVKSRNGAFKYPIGKHSTGLLMMGWTGMQASWWSQVSYGIYNKQIDQFNKHLGIKRLPFHFWTEVEAKPNSPYGRATMDYTIFKGIKEDDVEGYLHTLIQWVIKLLGRDFDFSSESALFKHLPLWDNAFGSNGWPQIFEGSLGVNYCFVQIMLGNFAFVEDYLQDKPKTGRPKFWKQLNLLAEKLPEYKALYDKQGYIFSPLK